MIKTIVSASVFNMAAQMVWNQLRDAAQRKKPVVLLLSGGSATKVYEEMVAASPVTADFSNLTVGLVDERFDSAQRKRFDINPNHAGSNAAAIEKTGLFAFFRSRGARVETMLHGQSMQEEIISYNKILNSLFMIHNSKIGIFGIGTDGHTAGIFPTKTIEEFTGIYRSLEDEVCVVGHHHGIVPFKDRITVTPSLISKLDHAFLIAQGENKKEPLQRLSKASLEDQYQTPAVMLKTAKNLTIFTDQTL